MNFQGLKPFQSSGQNWRLEPLSSCFLLYTRAARKHITPMVTYKCSILVSLCRSNVLSGCMSTELYIQTSLGAFQYLEALVLLNGVEHSNLSQGSSSSIHCAGW